MIFLLALTSHALNEPQKTIDIVDHYCIVCMYNYVQSFLLSVCACFTRKDTNQHNTDRDSHVMWLG